MKYLLIATYYRVDTSSSRTDIANNCWVFGTAETQEQAEQLADQEIEENIEEEVWCRFDKDTDAEEEIQDFRNKFEIHKYDNWALGLNAPMEIRRLYYDDGYIYETLNIYVIGIKGEWNYEH